MKVSLFMKHIILAVTICILMPFSVSGENETRQYDIVIYGGTSGGIAAAIQASRMGKSVVLIEPSRRIGGLTTGGLGQTDIGNKQAVGGISREFYQNISNHYSDLSNWKWQEKADYRDGGQTKTARGEDAMWTFEPSAALKVYHRMIAEETVDLVYEQRLDRENGVRRKRSRITEIQMESGEIYQGKMFIDASYEGDLLAAAGVAYIVGRESSEKYGESLNGVQANYFHPTLSRTVSTNGQNHNFEPGVDPYIERGNPSSGLLPFIKEGGKPGLQGAADRGVQAYCFRMTLTDHPSNRIPFSKPAGYRELDYELLFRNFEAGENAIPWINSDMPNQKTDTNNKHGFSTDFIGQNHYYPEASYAERDRIIKAHRHYQQGLMWSLANHPRVPQFIRDEVSRWGTCKDEYERDDGWQQQLYIREARRMVSGYVMRQQHCEGLEVAEDSVGMAAYGMDSHMVQRYVDANGFVQNEGNVQAHVIGPYPISYRSIVPKEEECSNLLVPVCLSSSHIGFGSIRMEPVFMVLGQSAATAACMAIDNETSIQNVSYEKLNARLVSDGQILNSQSGSLVNLDSLKGIVVDDSESVRVGNWIEGRVVQGIHKGYLHDQSVGDGFAEAIFNAVLPYTGEYEVQIAYQTQPDSASNVPVSVRHEGGETTLVVSQRKRPEVEGHFQSLGRFRFGKSASVALSNRDADGRVIADAVRWVLKRYDDPRERWSDNLLRWASEDEQRGGLDGGILFMGSSSVLMWDLKAGFGNYETRGRGFGGSKIWELPALYDEIVEPHKPDHIVIYTCENDLSIGRTYDEILDDWRVLYGRIRKELPRAQIYILSVKRSPRREYMTDKILEFNRILEAELVDMAQATFIDGDSPLIASNGMPDPGLFRDGLHLNEVGYRKWNRLINEAIEEKERSGPR